MRSEYYVSVQTVVTGCLFDHIGLHSKYDIWSSVLNNRTSLIRYLPNAPVPGFLYDLVSDNLEEAESWNSQVSKPPRGSSSGLHPPTGSWRSQQVGGESLHYRWTEVTWVLYIYVRCLFLSKLPGSPLATTRTTSPSSPPASRSPTPWRSTTWELRWGSEELPNTYMYDLTLALLPFAKGHQGQTTFRFTHLCSGLFQ